MLDTKNLLVLEHLFLEALFNYGRAHRIFEYEWNMKEMGIYIKMGLGFLYFVTSESWDEHHCAMFNLA
jgi:hypothetical protein